MHYPTCYQVGLIGRTGYGIETRSRQAIDAFGNQIAVRATSDQGWLGGAGTSSHEVKTADIGMKYLDAPTMRRLIGLLGVRLLTLDGAEARRCEDAQQVQDDGPFVFVWTAVVTAVIILVTVCKKCRNCHVVHTETLG